MTQFIISIFITLLVIISSSIGGEFSYNCEVKNVYSLTSNGSLKTSIFENKMKGSIFSVSRVNGEIIGKPITTALANPLSTKSVINTGSKDYSFKTISFFNDVKKPFSKGNESSEYTKKVQVLEVQEFVSSINKPFVAMSMSGAGLVTGICK